MEVTVLHYPSISLPTGPARESALKTIGGNIRRERTARLISQDKLAAVAGLNVRTLAKIEAGELNVRPETLDNIRRALGSHCGAFSELIALSRRPVLGQIR